MKRKISYPYIGRSQEFFAPLLRRRRKQGVIVGDGLGGRVGLDSRAGAGTETAATAAATATAAAAADRLSDAVEFELIFVDDGSRDQTWAKITELVESAEAEGRVRGLRLSRNFGKEVALTAGLDMAKGQAVVVMDGDLQHPPALLPKMIELWQQGYEVVEAVKVHRGKEGLVSRWGSRLFYWFFAKAAGFDLSGASDYKLLDAKVLEAWKRFQERQVFFRGVVRWMGFRVATVDFQVPERQYGQTKWSFLGLFRLALMSITAFSSLPLRLAVVSAGLFLIFAVVVASIILYLKLQGQTISGMATLVFVVLVTGSVILINLAIIGEYLARIYEEVKARPRYLIAQKASAEKTLDPSSGL